MSDETPAQFVVPEGSMGLLGSPSEFARLIRDGNQLPETSTVSLGPLTELRMFALPPGAPTLKAKIPGYNIRVIRPGAVLTSEEALDDD